MANKDSQIGFRVDPALKARYLEALEVVKELEGKEITLTSHLTEHMRALILHADKLRKSSKA